MWLQAGFRSTKRAIAFLGGLIVISKQAKRPRKHDQERGSFPSALVYLYLLFIILHLLPLISGSSDLWGIDQWRYLPGPVVTALVLLGLLYIFPPFRSGLIEIAERIGSSRVARRLKESPPAGYFLALAAAVLLFWSLRQATHFLGDGNLWLKTIEADRQCRSWDLIVSCSIYKTVSRGIITLLGVEARTAAGLIGIASGLLFLVFAWKTVRQLSERVEEQLFLLIALLSTGSIMLFFGYIEAYPPAAAGLMIYLYCASRALSGRGGVHAAAIACAAAVILHPSMIALLPSLALLYISMRGKRPSTEQYITAVSMTVLAGLAALWVLRRWGLFDGFFHEGFLPFLDIGRGNRISYPILSWSTVVDLLNELLLVCPVLLFAALLLPRRKGNGNRHPDRKVLFFGTVSLCFVLIFVVGNKLLGVSRDWDIFAPMAFPLALFTATALLDRYRHRSRDLAVLASFVLVLHTAPWVAINASTGTSLQRVADLARNTRWSDFARGYAYDALATYYHYDHDVPRALRYSIEAVEADPGNVRYLYNAATRYMTAGRQVEAVRMYENVVRRKPDYLDARINLGTIYMNMGMTGEALNEFLEAVRIDPTSVAACCKLADAYSRNGRSDEAIELYARAIELDSKNPEIYMNLAILRMNAGQRDRAARLFERAIDADPLYAPAYYNRGKIYAQEGDDERALEFYERYISLEPSSLDARFEVAVILDRAGRLEEALEHLRHIINERPADVGVMNNIGVIHSKNNEFDMAVRVFEEALEIDPDHPAVLLNAARAYYRLGDYSRAWEYAVGAERSGAAVPQEFLSDLRRLVIEPGTP
jgi:tetratricopeptide (TPR) repeat protein